MIWTVALTGGIASGKTLACRYFKALGAEIIDADIIARSALEHFKEEVIAHFGSEILTDDMIDRSALRARIFSSPEDLQWLNQRLHPWIRQAIGQAQEALSSDQAPYLILAIPLLTPENRAHYTFHRLCLLSVSPETQRLRGAQRDQLDAASIQAVMQTQLSDAQRRAMADDRLENNGSKQALEMQIQTLHALYLKLSADHRS